MTRVSKNAGRVSVVFKGDYKADFFYKKLDAVRYQRAIYVSLKPNNNAPVIDDKINWILSCKDGEDFKFDDFSPEQISLLQQPAIEAAERADLATSEAITATNNANTATNNANNATSNANNAAQAADQAASTASDATERTIVATTNARNATQNAIDATSEAEQKIDDLERRTQIAINDTISSTNAQVAIVDVAVSDANTAITNANKATTLANNAADFANSQRGWSPYFVFESDGAQRLVKKLADWIGGTGAKPTNNVGRYVTDAGGFTTVKANAANFKGEMGNNVITSYTHTGNKQVAVTSIDYTTNTFTSASHGLTNGQEVAFNVLPATNIITMLPFANAWNVTNVNSGFFVINATTDTFQLSSTSGGSVLPLVQRATVDFTKWVIEVVQDTSNLSMTFSPSKHIQVVVKGNTSRNARYVLPNGLNVYSGYKNAIYSLTVLSNTYNINGYILIDIITNSSGVIINYINKSLNINNSVLSMFNEDYYLIPDITTNLTSLTSIILQSFKLMNGCEIYIIKKS